MMEEGRRISNEIIFFEVHFILMCTTYTFNVHDVYGISIISSGTRSYININTYPRCETAFTFIVITVATCRRRIKWLGRIFSIPLICTSLVDKVRTSSRIVIIVTTGTLYIKREKKLVIKKSIPFFSHILFSVYFWAFSYLMVVPLAKLHRPMVHHCYLVVALSHPSSK